jgi:1-phosphofructokinase
MEQQIIVTVTANTTIDQTLFVPSLPMNRTTRATGQVYSMGGKPTDASCILALLGISSRAMGFAAGALGQKVQSILREKGAEPDFVLVNGETRLNTVIVVGDGSGQLTITTSTLDVEPGHIHQLVTRYDLALKHASVVVLGGTLPRGVQPDFYTELIARAAERRVPVIFDADEPNLSAGLASSPTYIKPNRDELEALTGQAVRTLADAYAAGRQIIARYGTQPIITLGSEGALAVLRDRAYFIPTLPIEVVSTSGAGDAMLAGIAASVHRRQPIEEGLRLGAAAAAAVCITPGTGDCRREDVERFLPQVRLEEYRP